MTFENEHEDTRGLSQREILLEVRSDLKGHVQTHDKIHDDIELRLGMRPTRSEIVRTSAVFFTGAGVLSGLIFGLIAAL